MLFLTSNHRSVQFLYLAALLFPLHLENCVREKKSAAAAPMHACLNDSPSTLAVFSAKKATKLQVVGEQFIWKAKVPGANASLVPLGSEGHKHEPCLT